MFKWSVPPWRRWHWHRWRRAYIAHTARHNRRAWVRYPCHVASSCHSEADPRGCPATVRNISLGGMSLLVAHPFESGMLLKVELQSTLENTPQLLCVRVIHVAQQADGFWALGCAFARELSDNTLRAFRTTRVLPLPSDRRSWWRPLGKLLSFRRSRGRDLEPCSARLLNASTAGVGMMVSRAFELGTPVDVELPGAGADTESWVRGRVVHAAVQPNGDWLIGCAFLQPLTPEQLQLVL